MVMKSALQKDIFRELSRTRSRFVSILLMVALASLFLCGLRSAGPDMRQTSDDYYDRQNLADLRVVSTLGLTEEDVQALAASERVAAAEGAYTLDALTQRENGEWLVRLHSLSERINVPVLVEGRLPSAPGECAVESQYRMGLQIGDTVTLYGEEELENQLEELTCTVTGVVESPYYIGLNRGTSSIGDGAVDAFLLLPQTAFSMECYTEINLLAQDAEALLCYGEAYDTLLEELQDTVEPLAEARVEQRYQDIMSDAQAEIDDAAAELEDGEAELQDEESTARAELADARAELDQGWADLADGQEQYDREIADAEAKLADAAKELEDGRQLLTQNERTVSLNRQELIRQEADAEAQLAAAEQELADGAAALEEGEALYAQGLAEYEAGAAALEEAKAALPQLRSQKEFMDAFGQRDERLITAIRELEQTIEVSEPQLAAAEAQLAASRAELDASRQTYEAGVAAFEEEQTQARAQLEDAWTQINYAESQLRHAREELEQGEQDYADGMAELEQAKIDGLQELQDAETELRQGELDYADGEAELNEKIADAREELDDGWLKLEDARSELASVERGKLYLMDRTTIPNYVGYRQDSERMDALGNVFPVLFFLVAALVCLTTMTRMVEEQRTQIGVLKAMGYGTWRVALKFLIYGSLAAAIGTAIGCVIGTYAIPWIICSCYGIMYFLPSPALPWHWGSCAGVAAASLGSTLIAVLWAVGASITRTPAELMRPRAPKAGRRIFLERITPIWKRLNFSAKVSARNLLRYQKRFWMTVIGVGGCTALIIAGFGLQEGILSVIDRQFGVIYAFDLQVTLSDTASETRRQETIEWAVQNAQSSAVASFCTVTLSGEDRSEEGYLTVAEDSDAFSQQYILRDYQTGEPVSLPEEGCVITQKLSELLKLSVGDEITINSEQKIPIRAICEQYVQHYVYLSDTAYAAAFGEPMQPDTLFLTIEGHDEAQISEVTERLLEQPAVLAVTNINASAREFRKNMSVVNYVVVIIIGAAAMLAFVVLYNLTNINITERIRELATLKVLGFFDRELAMYIYRENIVLTLLGIALGQGFGGLLSSYMVRTVEIDMVMFGRHATWTSYAWSILLSLVFALLVNLAMYSRMKKINMVESLKSIE